ncbi:hypothetical protein MMC24_002475 [Lignoscripta atroalba]|nr:hypothetical protein [Lignoscripta atroalba]
MDAQTPLLEKVVPPPFRQPIYHAMLDESTEAPLLEMDIGFPLPAWTFARRDKGGQQMPQAIAHRGYKAKHPENTMGAFRGAVNVGAHALETDIHLSKDGVVVISHDATLKRCYGKDDKIIDCSWDYLSTLRTLKAPHEPMPRLKDILEYLASPGLEEIWLLLDIKVGLDRSPFTDQKPLTSIPLKKPDNDADDVMRLIAQDIHSTPPHPSRPWNTRIVLGCWVSNPVLLAHISQPLQAKYVPLCTTYLPHFPITHIGISTSYARQFLSIPSISFNLLQQILMGPLGARFLRDARSLNRPVFAWTVNEEAMMRWSIRAAVDGVITDDPKKFREVSREWEQGKREVIIGVRAWLYVVWVHILVVIFGALFGWKYPQSSLEERRKWREQRALTGG